MDPISIAIVAAVATNVGQYFWSAMREEKHARHTEELQQKLRQREADLRAAEKELLAERTRRLASTLAFFAERLKNTLGQADDLKKALRLFSTIKRLEAMSASGPEAWTDEDERFVDLLSRLTAGESVARAEIKWWDYHLENTQGSDTLALVVAVTKKKYDDVGVEIRRIEKLYAKDRGLLHAARGEQLAGNRGADLAGRIDALRAAIQNAESTLVELRSEQVKFKSMLVVLARCEREDVNDTDSYVGSLVEKLALGQSLTDEEHGWFVRYVSAYGQDAEVELADRFGLTFEAAAG